MTPRAVFPWCGSPECPSASRTSLRSRDTEPRPVGGKLDSARERHAGPRVVREKQVAVEVDVIAEARDLRGRRDGEAGLDHAPEHHAEPERAGGARHADRFADPA